MIQSYCSILSALHLLLLTQQILANVLDGVLWLVLGQLFERLNQRWHDVLVKVLADGKVRVHGVSLLSCGLAVLRLSISRVYYQNNYSQQ